MDAHSESRSTLRVVIALFGAWMCRGFWQPETKRKHWFIALDWDKLAPAATWDSHHMAPELQKQCFYKSPTKEDSDKNNTQHSYIGIAVKASSRFFNSVFLQKYSVQKGHILLKRCRLAKGDTWGYSHIHISEWLGWHHAQYLEGRRRNGGIFGIMLFVFPSNCFVMEPCFPGG